MKKIELPTKIFGNKAQKEVRRLIEGAEVYTSYLKDGNTIYEIRDINEKCLAKVETSKYHDKAILIKG